MKYDFTQILDRKGKESRSYDSLGKKGNPSLPKEGFDPIPLFVADMDFAVAPSIQEALEKRIQHPIYGYFDVPDKFKETIIDWHEKTRGVTDLKPEYIGYENDVLGGLVSSLRALNKPGDKILLHAPTYIGFIEIINNLGYEVVTSELVKDDQGIFRMNFQDMDKKIKENNIKTLIICSPHNPMGRVWEKSELKQMSPILEENKVTVIADEIWSEIMINGHKHVPTQEGSDYLKNNTIALYSPNKGFNLAGLTISYHIIYNKDLRDKVTTRGLHTYYNLLNTLSLHALYGAYSHEGYKWLQELKEILSENINHVNDYFQENFPSIDVTVPQGTYIMMFELDKWLQDHNSDLDSILQKGYDYGIGWSDARPYNYPNGIKVNLALPRIRIDEFLNRLSKYVLVD